MADHIINTKHELLLVIMELPASDRNIELDTKDKILNGF